MNEQQLHAILQSDMKLWETAETTMDNEGTITKVIDLPYGIGEYSVTIEGVTNAEKRRAAVTGFGGSVRDVVGRVIGGVTNSSVSNGSCT